MQQKKSSNHKQISFQSLIILSVFFVLLLFSAYYLLFTSALASDQVKSDDFFATSSATAVSSAVDIPVTLYVGDNLSGVSTPVKSAYFTISGVYTGGGSITFTIDSDGVSTRTYTLPAVSAPTPYELVYKDPSGSKINPISAGSYTYTLNVAPSGVNIYGLSARITETHRYVPPACPDGSSSNEKVKTNEYFVGSSDALLSGATTSTFSLYIGDDIAGISNPVKTAYFVVTGVYTGGGTVNFMLDSDANSSRTYILPAVSAPTYIELVYKDTTGIINPGTPGVYQYTLTTNPSGVTFSNFGISFLETHRYKPGTCGGFPVKGDLYSAVFDTTGTSTGPSYNAILWKGTLGGPGLNQGKVRFQIASSDCANGATNYPACNSGTWSFIGGPTCASSDWFDPGAPDVAADIQANSCAGQLNDKRYFRYIAEICSDDCTAAGAFTPVVDDVIVNWAP